MIILWTCCEQRTIPIFQVKLLREEKNLRLSCKLAGKSEMYKVLLRTCCEKRNRKFPVRGEKVPDSPGNLLLEDKNERKQMPNYPVNLLWEEQSAPFFSKVAVRRENILILLWTCCERKQVPYFPVKLLWEKKSWLILFWMCEKRKFPHSLENLLWDENKRPNLLSTCCE